MSLFFGAQMMLKGGGTIKRRCLVQGNQATQRGLPSKGIIMVCASPEFLYLPIPQVCSCHYHVLQDSPEANKQTHPN